MLRNNALTNQLISALPQKQFGLLSPYIIIEQLDQGAVLIEAGEETENVYFPHNGMLSLQTVMKDGRGIATATVGREGVVGAMAGLGDYTSNVRVVVQLKAEVTRIAATRFRTIVARSSHLQDMCISSNEILLSQAQTFAACNALHVIEARLCRWLLQIADTAGSNSIGLTQQVLGEMLGVRRTSITGVARKLQNFGAIHYSLGEIRILDRRILERMSCECYQRTCRNVR